MINLQFIFLKNATTFQKEKNNGRKVFSALISQRARKRKWPVSVIKMGLALMKQQRDYLGKIIKTEFESKQTEG